MCRMECVMCDREPAVGSRPATSKRARARAKHTAARMETIPVLRRLVSWSHSAWDRMSRTLWLRVNLHNCIGDAVSRIAHTNRLKFPSFFLQRCVSFFSSNSPGLWWRLDNVGRMCRSRRRTQHEIQSATMPGNNGLSIRSFVYLLFYARRVSWISFVWIDKWMNN